ncbi:hypothetical protein [Vibrio parahaemolyticus]|uniref:hypothetical protein n=2 Tax=Vibrio parahaemolyticus TaxID=670 RepID=UPI001FAB6251|nr:hypothetical protein [Vibrio parahaemolyticus]MCS0010868.1 hypothetical protein [Vibrio parahaemolyticus]MDF5346264.1 hypothetical protein [Vibrio parahaemolyticus]
MSNRDEFLMTTKRALCDRAGNKCSFPTCSAPTSGPSDESDSSVDSTGMACHIFAAAEGKGAKRYDGNMSSEERRSVKNGIWMCYKHGKQIDNDECRFSSEILFKWKEVAERKAQIENELGRSIDGEIQYLVSLGLARHNVSILSANGTENALIGNALRDSCANAIWGKGLISYIRGFLIERTRNAFKHGGAKSIKLEIDVNKLTLIDDGDHFTHNELLTSPKARGGAKAKRELLEKYGNKIISVIQRVGNENHTTISLLTELDAIQSLTPCTVELTFGMQSRGNFNLEIFNSCSEVYVTLPEYFSTSDLYWLHTILPALDNDTKRLVFVMDEVADYISGELTYAYPDSRVIDLSKC